MSKVLPQGLDADVVIIGAGSAGAMTALACARRGLRALCLERRPLEEAGARWVNGVPDWLYAQVGLEAPAAPELRPTAPRFHMYAGSGPTRLSVDSRSLLEVDMRHLIARLQALASRAGATLMGEQRLLGWSPGPERVELHTAAGRLTCRWVVDAAGLKGAGLLEAPPVPAEDICAAAQELRLVRDPQQAAAWVKQQGAELGDTLCFSSVAGGYSIVNACVEEGEPWTVSLLTGSMPAAAGVSGAELLRRFVEEQTWIGEPLFGGSRPIPVGRPQLRLDAGPLMRVGDAAGQVYASHGSGVAMGMLAGDLLAQVLAEGGSPWDYTWRWQRRWGPLLFASALFARHSRSLNATITGEMMRQGVITPGLMGQALLQRPARPGAADLRQLAFAAVSAPRLIAAQLPTLARMSLVEAHCARFPQDPSGLSRWTRTLDSIWS